MDIAPDLPAEWATVETLDTHAGGEPLRIVTSGAPTLEGDTILERRDHLRTDHDDFRTTLMFEPRGHTDMYGALLTDPVTPDADIGVVFMHNEGYSTMCGHGVIALGTALPRTNAVKVEAANPVIRMDTPAGLVTARLDRRGDRVREVAFENVPSFVEALDNTVTVDGLGEIQYDLAYGGAYYAYVDAADAGVELEPEHASRLARIGMRIKEAVARDHPLTHPTEPDLGFLYGTIFTGPPKERGDTRNVCVFADGQIDRSPTGTGVSGRLAIESERNNLTRGDAYVVESIIDTTFTGRIETTLDYHGRDAVRPEVAGTAAITGTHRFCIDPRDPLKHGFLLE